MQKVSNANAWKPFVLKNEFLMGRGDVAGKGVLGVEVFDK